MDDKNEKKQGVNMPEHTGSSADHSSKAENIKNAAAAGVVRMGDNTVNSLRSVVLRFLFYLMAEI